ncbi:hypothetical protein [Desulfitobacterium hafniense]|uniref:hypothetical protein n=1 Tax=Desulfitobacterium hafniense TaxID=49338 RepID=UPI0013BEAA9E|nr:hypothetical protein [Desulfitobacterium hafniense]
METGRFQPAIEQERFGGRNPGEGFAQAATPQRTTWRRRSPFGAESLSVSFVRAAY